MLIQSNYPTTNSQYVKNTERSNNSNAQISFGGNKARAILAGVGLLFGGGALYVNDNVNYLHQLEANYPDLFNTNESQLSEKSGWGSNVRVIASTGQNVYGFGSENDGYSVRLMDKLSDSSISTIEQANDSLKKGYKIKTPFSCQNPRYLLADFMAYQYLNNKTLFSLETPGAKLNIFDKRDKSKNRYVLNFYDTSSEKYKNHIDFVSSQMKKLYHLQNENIISLPVGSLADFEMGVDSIANKINCLKNKDNVELMVLLNGEAGAVAKDSVSKRKEGGMIGAFLFGDNLVTEHDLKTLFKQKLPQIPILIDIDACHSGAWIADKAKHALNAIV